MAKPGLQPHNLTLGLCSAPGLGSRKILALGGGHWLRQSGACFTGSLIKAQDQSRSMGLGTDCEAEAQGLELELSIIYGLFLGSRQAPSRGQAEPTGVGPLVCDKETLDSAVLMARV